MVLPLVGRRHARPRGLLATLLVLRPTNNDETPSSPPPWNQSVSRSFRGAVYRFSQPFFRRATSWCLSNISRPLLGALIRPNDLAAYPAPLFAPKIPTTPKY